MQAIFLSSCTVLGSIAALGPLCLHPLSSAYITECPRCTQLPNAMCFLPQAHRCSNAPSKLSPVILHRPVWQQLAFSGPPSRLQAL